MRTHLPTKIPAAVSALAPPADSTQQIVTHHRCCWNCHDWTWLAYNVYSGTNRLLKNLPTRYTCPKCETARFS